MSKPIAHPAGTVTSIACSLESGAPLTGRSAASPRRPVSRSGPERSDPAWPASAGGPSRRTPWGRPPPRRWSPNPRSHARRLAGAARVLVNGGAHQISRRPYAGHICLPAAP